MPNPKDYMDDDHEYVRGYVRRKYGTDSITEPKRLSWFWRISWYWRFLMIFGAIALVIALVITKHLMLLGGLVLAIVIWGGIGKSFFGAKRKKRRAGKGGWV